MQRTFREFVWDPICSTSGHVLYVPYPYPTAFGGVSVAFPPLESETSRPLISRPNDEQIADYYSAIIGTKIFDTILLDGPSRLEELQDS